MSSQDFAKRMRESEEELKKGSKPLSELVEWLNFDVESVLSISEATSIFSIPESRIGGEDMRCEAGYTSRLVLGVRFRGGSVPIKILNFNGNSVVQAGQYIRATMPIYEEKRLGFEGGERKKGYFPRYYKREELAIKIEIWGGSKIIREDRSVDYGKFVKD